MTKTTNRSKRGSQENKSELMYPNIGILFVIDNDGNKIKVTKWLKNIANKIPNTLRYKDGKKAGQLVDHYSQLKSTFKKGGRRAVKNYVKECSQMLDEFNKLLVLKSKVDRIINYRSGNQPVNI